VLVKIDKLIAKKLNTMDIAQIARQRQKEEHVADDDEVLI